MRDMRLPAKARLTRSANGHGRCVRQMGGRGEYGHVKVRVHPGDPGSGLVFENKIIGEAIPTRFMAAVEQGLREAAMLGVPAGYRVDDARVELEDGSYHEVDSSETAFRLAATFAFQDASDR
jgi:elongation factor G